MDSTTKTLSSKYELELLQLQRQSFVFLISKKTCKPCTFLKPELIKKCQEEKIDLYMAERGQDEELDAYVGVKKVPYVIVFREGELIDGLQHSNIKKVWPFVDDRIHELVFEDNF